jgi:hypothetical protein
MIIGERAHTLVCAAHDDSSKREAGHYKTPPRKVTLILQGFDQQDQPLDFTFSVPLKLTQW